jgi:hypothetical protein
MNHSTRNCQGTREPIRAFAHNSLVLFRGFWPAQIVTTEVQLDVSGHGILCALGTEVAQFRIFVLKQSVAAAAGAVAKDMMADFMDYRVHGIFSRY